MDQIKSSVRPIVTYAFMLGILWGFCVGKISAEMFVPVAVSCISHWFGSRSGTGVT